MHGKLIFKYGCMGSGKSLHLLATAYNFEEHHIPFLILKSEIDSRNGNDTIHSRALGERECATIKKGDNIYEILKTCMEVQYVSDYETPKWILVDEAQFLSEKQIEELAAISDNYGINIICYGLRTDFQSKLFPGSKRLFEIADSFEEIKSSCYCNGKTIFNARVNQKKEIITNGNQIEIGGDEKYIALCRKCYFEKTNHNLYKNLNKKD